MKEFQIVYWNNIPKQKQKNPNNPRTHPKRPDRLAVRSEQTTNISWHCCASSPSISHIAKGANCCSLVGVSVQVSQLIAPYHILLCKTGLVMVVKQPWQCKGIYLPISKQVTDQQGLTWKELNFVGLLLKEYFPQLRFSPNWIRSGMWREDLERVGVVVHDTDAVKYTCLQISVS